MAPPPPPTLGYWGIRGLGQPIRYMLEFAGVDYEDKRYTCGPLPQLERTEYLATIGTLGLDFPNLPYYIDGDIKLTQSQVIMRHLARKHNLAGNNEFERARADMLSTTLYFWTMDYKDLIINPNFAKLRGEYADKLVPKLKSLAEFLGANKFVAGDTITFADFMLFEFIEAHLYFDQDILANYPSLGEFHKRVRALEPIDKYFKSDRCIKYPFGGPPAYFAGPYTY